MNKICSDCSIEKPLSEYTVHKATKDGLRSKCKACGKLYKEKYNKTKDGLVVKIYGAQICNSKHRGHRKPEYTRQELQEWMYSQETFHRIYSEWKQSGYLKRLTPSVDRKHDDIHYCMNNIQLMTWGENDDKAHNDCKIGKLQRGQKIVSQFTRGGELIATYHSAAEAARQTNIHRGDISSTCRGKLKSAGGYVWEFATKDSNE